MLLNLTLDQAAASGQPIDTIAGTIYSAAVVVIAQSVDPCGAEPSIYCMMVDWPQTPAGREFDLKARLAIAEADAAHIRVAANELRADLATAQKRLSELEAALAARPTLPSEHVCEECGKAFPTLPAVRIHVARAHRGMQTTKQRAKAEPEAPPEVEVAPETPPVLPARPTRLPLPDDPAWRCARCDKGTQDGAFTRSLTRPELCLRCASTQDGSTQQSAIAA